VEQSGVWTMTSAKWRGCGFSKLIEDEGWGRKWLRCS